MKQSTEVEYCKKLFNTSRRSYSLELIEDSSLTDWERNIVYKRYIEGYPVKDICVILNIDEEAYKKQHRKILTKFYNYLIINNLINI